MDNKKLQFQQSLLRLLKEEPFYAHFVLNSSILFDAHGVPTAGATVINGTPTLVFNTKFMETKTVEQYSAIIKHEILHLLFNHTDFFGKEQKDAQIWNIAMDCCINQYIDNLPEDCITLEKVSKLAGVPLLPLQTSTYYFEKLKSKQKELEGTNSHDDHEFSPENKDKGNLASASIKSIVKKAKMESAENISEDLNRLLETLADSKLPWKQLLKNFVLNQVTNKTRGTKKKINRRFGIDAPGKIKVRTLKLGICVDSSGSISDENFKEFMSEVKQICNQGVEVVLIDADCEVKNVQKIKTKKDFKATRSGNGGTAYQPAIDECMKHKVSAIVYFGDMDSADVPKNPKVPFMWIVAGNQDAPASFGKTIRL